MQLFPVALVCLQLTLDRTKSSGEAELLYGTYYDQP